MQSITSDDKHQLPQLLLVDIHDDAEDDVQDSPEK
jgi:hypothetical protein